MSDGEKVKVYFEGDAPPKGELWGRHRGIRNQQVYRAEAAKTVHMNAFCEVCDASVCGYKAPNRHK